MRTVWIRWLSCWAWADESGFPCRLFLRGCHRNPDGAAVQAGQLSLAEVEWRKTAEKREKVNSFWKNQNKVLPLRP